MMVSVAGTIGGLGGGVGLVFVRGVADVGGGCDLWCVRSDADAARVGAG